MEKINQLSRQTFTVTYTDACPSELIHNSTDNFLSIAFVNFWNIDRTVLHRILQFKNTRGLDRRIKTQDYIISAITTGAIMPVGVVSWNERLIALENGKFILNKYKLIPHSENMTQKVELAGEFISYGHAVSLAWYSMALAMFAKNLGPMTKFERKKKAAILIDLLPGDNVNYRKNLKIVNHIIDNTEFEEFFADVLKEYSLDGIGLAYGIKDGSTKTLKEDFEFTVTDWIAQSFNSLVRCEKLRLGKQSDEYQLAKLAQFLLYRGQFKLVDGFILRD